MGLLTEKVFLVVLHIRRHLEKNNFSVLQALDGAQGIKMAREYKPDAITLDILMPEMDGPTLLQMRPLEPAAKVILMSAFTGKYDSDKAQKMGADLFIPKPFEDINEVIQVAENLIK